MKQFHQTVMKWHPWQHGHVAIITPSPLFIVTTLLKQLSRTHIIEYKKTMMLFKLCVKKMQIGSWTILTF